MKPCKAQFKTAQIEFGYGLKMDFDYQGFIFDAAVPSLTEEDQALQFIDACINRLLKQRKVLQNENL